MDEIELIEYKNAIRGIMEFSNIHAEAVRSYYDALIEKGFTKHEAFQLVKCHGYMPPTQIPPAAEEE